MVIDIPKPLKEFCDLSPYPVYAVGGLVRNALLGYSGGDLDICGAYPVDALCGNRAEYVTINKRLGTAEIRYKGLRFEYTRFRSELYDGSGAHSPIAVEFVQDIESDAKRRDFTAGSLYYDIKNDKIIDVLGGIKDIKNKRLRAYDPVKVFESDGLRLMRLCRLAAELGFDIEENTAQAAKQSAYKLKDIAAERKRDELDKILNADLRYGNPNAHYIGIKLLYDIGLFGYILPCFLQMDIPQNPDYHAYSVLEHTFLTVKYADPLVRLAALMHDTGKPVCQKRDGNMYDHAAQSEKIVRAQLGQNGLKYPKKVVAETAKLCKLHMYDMARNTSSGKMRVFTAQNFDIIDQLQLLCLADGRATGNNMDNLCPRFLQFKNLLLKDGTPIKLSDLKVDGNDAYKTGLRGAEIKTALSALHRECILNPSLNDKKRLLARLKNWKL